MSIASYAVPPIVIYNTSVAQDPNTNQLDGDSARMGAFLCSSCIASAVCFIWACYNAPKLSPLGLAYFFVTVPKGGTFCLQTSQDACSIFQRTLEEHPDLLFSARAMM